MTHNMKKKRGAGDESRSIAKSRKTLSLENDLIAQIHVLRRRLGLDFNSACKLLLRKQLERDGVVIKEVEDDHQKNIPKKYLE